MQSVADFVQSLSQHPKQDGLTQAIETNISLYSQVFLNTLMEMSESVSLPENLLAADRRFLPVPFFPPFVLSPLMSAHLCPRPFGLLYYLCFFVIKKFSGPSPRH